MQKISGAKLLGALALSLILTACAGGGYSTMGAKTTSSQGPTGGVVTVSISKANGSSTQSIDEAGNAGAQMEVDVALAVGKGSYKIELLGKDDQVTLALEAHDGQTVTGHGQMVVDPFGEANYRVAAENAENVDYQLQYVYR
jgi:hypothetical protein